MIDRLVQVRNALERMVVDDDWNTFMRDLRRSHTIYMRCFAVRRFVRSDGFWNTCKNFLYMVIPVVKALHVFDGKAPAGVGMENCDGKAPAGVLQWGWHGRSCMI